jgi:uncharacterized protein (DUF2267 family)
MIETGIAEWDIEASRSSAWIDEFLRRLGWHDRKLAYDGFKATLHALRDYLDAETAATLAQSLPALIRGDFFDGWRPGDKPLALASREDFFDRVHDAVHRNLAVDPELVVRAAFAELQERLPPSDTEEIKSVAPASLRGLWPV